MNENMRMVIGRGSILIAAALLSSADGALRLQDESECGYLSAEGTILEVGGQPYSGPAFFLLEWSAAGGRSMSTVNEVEVAADGTYELVVAGLHADLPTGRIQFSTFTLAPDRGLDEVFASATDGRAAFQVALGPTQYTESSPKYELDLDDLQLALPPSVGSVAMASGASLPIQFDVLPPRPAPSGEYIADVSSFSLASGANTNSVTLYSWSTASSFRVPHTCAGWGTECLHRSFLPRGTTLSLAMEGKAVIKVDCLAANVTRQSSIALFDGSTYSSQLPTIPPDGYDKLVLFQQRMDLASGEASVYPSKLSCVFPVTLGSWGLELWDGPSIARRHSFQTYTVASPGVHTLSM